MSRFARDTTDIEALRRALAAAIKDGDDKHAAALRQAIRFHTQVQREEAAGVDNPVALWME